MKVLMLGWELPPFNSGGLGEACLGLSRALSQKGVGITFVLPKKLNYKIDFMNLLFADIDEATGTLISSYMTQIAWSKLISSDNFPCPNDYVAGSLKFAEKIKLVVKNLKESVDIIHAHDWLTYPAGIVAKEVLKKPLVAHIHATEFDRTGGHFPNPQVFAIEKQGFEKADRVIPVGGFMRNVLIEKYGVAPDKIHVVYNGIDSIKKDLPPTLGELKKLGFKIVLYHGRITLQKGPEYFVRAAKRVSEYFKKVVFVVSGSGDMQEYMISEAARLGVLGKFIFAGALWGDERDRVYQAADIFVMPSVSEPFGITALEAVINGTPVLVSKQSGVAEVLKNALKADFWDTDEMANKIVSVLKYKSLKKDLRGESGKEAKHLTWSRAADEVIGVYNELL
jgi:glycosyltransferase involved in cell wall biosynthesis